MADLFKKVKKMVAEKGPSADEGNFVNLSDNAAQALINELKYLDDFKARSLANGAKRIMR